MFGQGAPRPRPAFGRTATLIVTGAALLTLAGTAVQALAGAGRGGVATPSSTTVSDDVGYTGGPSYLDPSVSPLPLDLRAGVETYSVAPVELVSRRSDVPGDLVGGTEPTMSADGRYVAFTAPVTDDPSRTTVMLRDRVTGELWDLTPDLAGFTGRSSRRPVLSADGCTIAVITQNPYDVFRDDDRGDRWDVYRQVLAHCATNPDEGGGDWELMSTAPGSDDSALDAVDPASALSLSESGTVVAFVARAAERFGGPFEPSRVYVADATVPLGDSGRVVAVPGLPAGRPAAASATGQWDPALSRDGRRVAFTSDARADLADPVWSAPDGAGVAVPQVFVWDRTATALPVLVSADRAGQPVEAGAGQPAITPDGAQVAFVARAGWTEDGDLEVACTTCAANVFVVSRAPDGTEERRLVSADAGELGDGDSASPSFALDGRLVGFVTRARNLAPGAVGGAGTYVVTDLVDGRVTVATTEAGSQRPAAVVTGRAVLGDSGRSVVVETTAPNVLGAAVVDARASQVVALTSTPSVRLDDVDLGTTFVNEQTARSTTLTNNGPGAFVPASIASTSSEFVVAGGTCQVGVPVPAGDSCTVELLFSASSLGFSNSRLVVAESGVAAVTVTAAVTGSGGVPKIESEPATLVFAETLVGTDGGTLAVTVRNAGNGATALAAATIVGTHPGDFTIDRDGCVGRELADLASCRIEVRFGPTTSGGRSAVLMVTAADGSVTRTVLSGRGKYEPGILVGPASVESGDRVWVSGTGFPVDSQVTVSWEGGRAVLARTDAAGNIDVRLSTVGVVPGQRRVVVSDAVPVGATPRFAPLRTQPVLVVESSGSVNGNSPVFD